MDLTVSSLVFVFLTFSLSAVSSDDELVDKRRPGWGKRSEISYSETLDNLMEKRKPGWGKRFDDEINKRKPGWGKRGSDDDTNVMDKRRPGWGKRAFDDEFGTLDKRRPGWGKRGSDLHYPVNTMDIFKRKPGWGKRSQEFEKRKPGWGKRSSVGLNGVYDTKLPFSSNDFFSVLDKRRPGWGKRSDDNLVERRRPGWGKRAPGWGKRANIDPCQSLEEEIERLVRLLLKAETRRRQSCSTPDMDDFDITDLLKL